MSDLPEIVLASTSPYRKALMERLRLPFRGVDPEVDENPFKQGGHGPSELAETLARAKAFAAASRYPEAVVIGSDQVAAVGERILGKPGTAAVAKTQLESLSGREHQLYTSVAIANRGRIEIFQVVTRLWMRRLAPDEIDRYLALDEPYDCAGSYRIEALGFALFEEICCGDQTAIVGLPLMELARRLRAIGFLVP